VLNEAARSRANLFLDEDDCLHRNISTLTQLTSLRVDARLPFPAFSKIVGLPSLEDLVMIVSEMSYDPFSPQSTKLTSLRITGEGETMVGFCFSCEEQSC
jgi:hypothetical protein